MSSTVQISFRDSWENKLVSVLHHIDRDNETWSMVYFDECTIETEGERSFLKVPVDIKASFYKGNEGDEIEDEDE